MRSVESLMALLGLPITSDIVQDMVASESLEQVIEDDLEERESTRGYLSCSRGGYSLAHTDGFIDTIFVFVARTEKYQPFRGPLLARTTSASTRDHVRKAFGEPERSGEPKTVPVLGRYGAFDRYRQGDLYLHFEYTEPDERIKQITVMTSERAPR
jgi:hypothetical protein